MEGIASVGERDPRDKPYVEQAKELSHSSSTQSLLPPVPSLSGEWLGNAAALQSDRGRAVLGSRQGAGGVSQQQSVARGAC